MPIFNIFLSLFAPVPSSPSIVVVGGYGNGNGGSALNALQNPLAIAISANRTLYVVDSDNQRVLKLNDGSLTGEIVAGTGTAGSTNDRLNNPTGIFVDAASNVYVTDTNNFRVMRWARNATTGVRVAGTGSSGNTLSTFTAGSAVYVDAQENLYLSDYVNHRIMKWTPNMTNAVLVAGTGTSGSGNIQLNTPYGFDIDEANAYLYVADSSNNRIQRFQLNVSTVGVTVAGGNGAGSGSHQLNGPISVCVSKVTNAIYITDAGNGRVQRWYVGAANGSTIIGSGATVANYSTPLSAGAADLRLSSKEEYLYVSESARNRVLRYKLF